MKSTLLLARRMLSSTLISALILSLVTFSCSTSNKVDPQSTLQQAAAEPSSLDGVLVFKNHNSMFQYMKQVGSKSKQDRIIIESKYGFTSIATLFEDLNSSTSTSSVVLSSLIKKGQNEYEYTTGGMFFSTVANKRGYFIIDGVLKQVDNLSVKSVKLSSLSLEALKDGYNQIKDFDNKKLGSGVNVTFLNLKQLTAQSGREARVSPGSFSEETLRRNAQGGNLKFSAKLNLTYIGYVYTETICEGGYQYDEYGNLQCSTEPMAGDTYSYARIYGQVEGLANGSPQYDDNNIYTKETEYYADLSLYLPGNGIISIQTGGSANAKKISFELYNAQSPYYDSSAPYLEGHISYSATHETLPGAVTVTASTYYL